ncbi:MAG: EAL domain-containing protein [Betaproteobacteria bacterium]|nr:EAL domain-containing protein [Betaproteobacteria bacterium]
MSASAESGIVPIVRRLALAFALTVTVTLPAGYFGLDYWNHVEHVELSARLKAEGLTALVAANPELWIYQLRRLEELLLRYPPQLTDDRAIIRDAAGNALITLGASPPAPVLVRAFPIYDSGRLVGRVEITHSIRDLVLGTLAAGLLGLLLGALVYATLLVLPLRALRRVTVALDRETAALRASEARFRTVAQTAADAIVTYDAVGNVVGWNAAAEKIFGYPAAEVIGRPLTLLIPQQYQDGGPGSMNGAPAGGERRIFGKPVERQGRTRSGSEFPLELALSEWESPEGKFFTGIIRDITERKNHELRISRLNRTLAVLSGINSAIVRISDRQELFTAACRIAVEHGNFDMAWIGLVDLAAQEVTPAAWAGVETGEFLGGVKTRIRDDVPAGRGVLARAIRAGKPVFENDMTVEPHIGGTRRQDAIRRGYRSHIVLPLTVEGGVVASLSLFAKEAGFFNEDEIRLLTELADDISFALEHMAKQDRIAKLSRIRAVSSGINAAIVRIRDREELFQEACRIVVEHGNFVMAWIGMLDKAAPSIRPVARAGRDEGYLDALNLSIDSNITGNMALAAEAVAGRAPVVCNDIEADGRMRPWRTAALERGYRSVAQLPLVLEQRAVGVFALYAGEPGIFDEEELKLLVEMAGDVSFALEHMSKEERLNYLAYYDALTGLPNRALFVDRTNQRMRARGGERRMVALILLDLERFRNINETLGRGAGDGLLRQVAARLAGAVEESDVLAHVGGDQFAIATRRAERGEDVAHILDQTVTRALSQSFEIGRDQLRIAARTGVAVYPTDGADAEGLLRNAEAALNDAKKTGHRYLFYAPQMNARVAEQLRLENELRKAVAGEQFLLHYQPRFEIATKRIVGLEALIRWRHPERGIVSPADFIPLLEETGMILEVGRWALRRAAMDHAAWCTAGFKPPRIAVNVSQVQLRRKDFVDCVKDSLAAVDRAAERIDIEITESMLMEDVGGSIEKLKAVQSLGLNVAVDDFGTGYSSLNYLARLPINSLKIDRSFIIQMNKGPEQMAIVSTVISLARALNLKVVAEGVETEEQANLLRLLRCDEAQGYLYARPMPPDAIAGLLPRN